MTKFLTVSAMALVATAAVAVAQPTPAPAGPDQVMTRGDVQAKVRQHFAQLDANKDGAITTAEIGEMKMQHGGVGGHDGMKMHGGAMHGGAMPGGAMHDPVAAFDRLDANKDGSISRDEFAKGREMRIEKRIVMNGGEGSAPGGMGKHHMGGGKMGGGGMAGGRMIVMADTNKDGRITLPEAEAMALQHFDKMDVNRDGQVTRDERRAGRPMMIKMRQAPKVG